MKRARFTEEQIMGMIRELGIRAEDSGDLQSPRLLGSYVLEV